MRTKVYVVFFCASNNREDAQIDIIFSNENAAKEHIKESMKFNRDMGENRLVYWYDEEELIL